MNQIAGRKKECELLERISHDPAATLVAVYGRRRIGKTYLIKHFFKERGLYFQLTGIYDAKQAIQLHNFAREFSDVFSGEAMNETPSNWQSAFDRLRRAIEKQRQTSSEKIILFFDELPWLASARSGFMQALEHCWNRYLVDVPNLILIVCGSAASWMIKNVIRQRGGLHGRVNHKIHLKPFTLAETEAFLQQQTVQMNRKQIIELYMAFGGVAHYLKNIPRGYSANQAINEICFSQHGSLHNEFQDLYRSLFKNHQKHLSVVNALATKKHGLTYQEVSKKVKISSGGGLSSILTELLASGFIELYYEFGQSQSKGKYRLIDEFSIFYLKWCQTNESRSENYWIQQQNSARWKSWSGNAFEGICLKHIDAIKKALGIAGVQTSQSQWILSGNKEMKGAQIDAVLDRKDQCINLIEAKYYDDKVTITKAMAENLRHKKTAFIEKNNIRKAVFITLISIYGIQENNYSRELIDNQLTVDDLFNVV